MNKSILVLIIIGTITTTVTASSISEVFAKKDKIEGTDGPDSLAGTDDDDTINSGDGNDLNFGASGDDKINSGDGNDENFGDAGDDTITGSDGNDTIWGGDGTDSLDGGSAGTDFPGRRCSRGGIPCACW